MRKSQISLEYMILFSFVLVLFLVGGTVVVSGLGRTNSGESEAQYVARSIKSATLTASIADAEYRTEVSLPASVGDKRFKIIVYADPDNILIVKDAVSNITLARAFLPVINRSTNLEGYEGSSIIIEKIDGKITVKGK